MFFCQWMPHPVVPAQPLPGLHCLQVVAKPPQPLSPELWSPGKCAQLTWGCTSAGHITFAPAIPSVSTDILLDARSQKELWQILYFQEIVCIK